MEISLRRSDEGADLIEVLAVPYRAPAAYKALLQLGSRALPAVRAGLRHGNADVRFHCCRFLDRYLRPDTLADLLAMLADSDERVRVTTLHTLCLRSLQGRIVSAGGSPGSPPGDGTASGRSKRSCSRNGD